MQEIEKNEDLATTRNELGDTLLHVCNALHYGSVQLTTALISAGLDVNSQNHKGETPLHRAILAKNKEVVQSLLSAKAPVNVIDTHGKTAMMLAKECADPAIVNLLLAVPQH